MTTQQEPVSRLIRLLLVDDHEVVRRGIVMLLELEDDMEVVGQAGDGEEAVDLALAHCPDVVLMDVQLPGINGLEAAARIMAQQSARVVMLTALKDDEVLEQALRSGVSGFVLKSAAPEEILYSIRVAAGGAAHLQSEVASWVIQRFVDAPTTAGRNSAALADLTEREREVLTWVGRGRSNKEIAAELTLGETTIKTHISSIFTKTGVRDRSQAVSLAYETGLVVPGP